MIRTVLFTLLGVVIGFVLFPWIGLPSSVLFGMVICGVLGAIVASALNRKSAGQKPFSTAMIITIIVLVVISVFILVSENRRKAEIQDKANRALQKALDSVNYSN